MAGGDDLWDRYCRWHLRDDALGFSMDVSRVRLEPGLVEGMEARLGRALEHMRDLEGGAIANRDESRMVGHYWLRDPDLAPSPEIARAIRASGEAVRGFARRVHEGEVCGEGGAFRHLLHVGIGGSALGPQLVCDALGDGRGDSLRACFLDNTDPDGIDRLLRGLEGELGRTLVTVVSKSGGTPEPRNGMLEVRAAYERAGLAFPRHAVAVTMEGSRLDRTAREEGFLARFPMWDWVGGRTSVLSAVGLLPAALLGIDVRGLLDGAAAMDRLTRRGDLRRNPAALLALVWHTAGGGRGERNMVILPYKDRLALLGRYLQQLVMESLGKERDRRGRVVHQGMTVYGNKGSTDQHAYVQQLRDGPADFFVTFLQVLRDREGISPEVEPGTTAGDYLLGFLLGTRRALWDGGRESVTLTLDELTPRTLGALVALFERAVGLYAELVDVNAYDQPGVEAGKRAARDALDLGRRAVAFLRSEGTGRTAGEIAAGIGAPDESETVYKILEHLAANPGRGITRDADAASPREALFRPLRE